MDASNTFLEKRHVACSLGPCNVLSIYHALHFPRWIQTVMGVWWCRTYHVPWASWGTGRHGLSESADFQLTSWLETSSKARAGRQDILKHLKGYLQCESGIQLAPPPLSLCSLCSTTETCAIVSGNLQGQFGRRRYRGRWMFSSRYQFVSRQTTKN